MNTSQDQITARHTPGPWERYRDEEGVAGESRTQITHKGGIIAYVCGTEEFPCLDATDEIEAEFAANAALIAAAPDFESATAYLVCMTFTEGKYWDKETVEWARGVLKNEKRTGAEIVSAAINGGSK